MLEAFSTPHNRDHALQRNSPALAADLDFVRLLHRKENVMKHRIEHQTRKQAVCIALKAGVFGALLSVLSASQWTSAQEAPRKPSVLAEQEKRLELMKSKGPEASLTILPIRLAGKPFDRVTEVVGLLVEQRGLKNIELGSTAFNPEDKTAMEGLVVSLGEFIRKNPITTEYALYAEYNGSRQTGLDELRAVIVDKTGAPVWTDRQTPQDEAFKRLESREPMTLSVLLVERLSPQLSLSEETAKTAKPGKMARLMEERSGLPPENERAPLPGRQETMRKSLPKATLVVFPIRIGGNAADAAGAADLAKMIDDAGLCKAEAAKNSLLLKASQADPNELKVLWDLAREFRDHARNNPADADYVLYADYVFSPQNWEQGIVHFVVCDRKGEWVIVDMQNSHHDDYQSIKPISKDGCNKLLVKRLKGYLK
jgi:hypothetical protein